MLVVNGLGKPILLSLDWLTRTIYVVDVKTNVILATDLSGKKLTMIVSTGPSPTVLKVDPIGRRIYWASDRQGGIMTSCTDGSDKRILTPNARWVTSMAFDYPAGRLYWADRGLRRIESIGLDDKDQRTVKDFVTMQPMSLDLFEDNLVVAFQNQSIVVMHKHGTESPNASILADHEKALLLVYHPLKQNISRE